MRTKITVLITVLIMCIMAVGCQKETTSPLGEKDLISESTTKYMLSMSGVDHDITAYTVNKNGKVYFSQKMFEDALGYKTVVQKDEQGKDVISMTAKGSTITYFEQGKTLAGGEQVITSVLLGKDGDTYIYPEETLMLLTGSYSIKRVGTSVTYVIEEN